MSLAVVGNAGDAKRQKEDAEKQTDEATNKMRESEKEGEAEIKRTRRNGDETPFDEEKNGGEKKSRDDDDETKKQAQEAKRREDELTEETKKRDEEQKKEEASKRDEKKKEDAKKRDDEKNKRARQDGSDTDGDHVELVVTGSYGEFTGTVIERVDPEWTSYSSLVRNDNTEARRKRSAKKSKFPALTLAVHGDYETESPKQAKQKGSTSSPPPETTRIMQLIALLAARRRGGAILGLWMVNANSSGPVERVQMNAVLRALDGHPDPARVAQLQSITDQWTRNLRASGIAQSGKAVKTDSTPKGSVCSDIFVLLISALTLPAAHSVCCRDRATQA